MTFQGTAQTGGANSRDFYKYQSDSDSSSNGFNDKDFRNFAASFSTLELIKAASLRRVGDVEGAELIGRKPRAGAKFDGILFPYFIPGESYPREYRLRRDTPDLEQQTDGSTKEKAKYVSSPGARNMLYFSPNVTSDLLKDTEIPIVITEGEKKTLALHRLSTYGIDNFRFLPVGLSGVWNFRGTVGKVKVGGDRQNVKGTIPDFQLIEWKDRKVSILFDGNVATNESVSAARKTLARTLRELGAKVYYVDLPQDCEVNGVDDYLGAIEQKKGIDEAVKAGLDLLDSAYQSRRTNPLTANFELISDGSREPGVYFTEDTGERFFVCSPLEILAETQTETGENYGRLLKWTDSKDRVHTWAVPMPFLHGEGNEVAKRLVSEGLELMPSKKHREKLAYYIATSKPEKTIICTDKIGWHGSTYVLPDETFGGESNVVLQTENNYHKFNTNGSLTDWQQYVSKYCAGNSRLAFVVAAAFACPLLPIVDIPGGGFHFRGPSSAGKTTAAHVGGSVFGGSDEENGYCQTWKATSNGLESVAASHNHALLCLDEIGECDARQIGDIAYMLANGHGKQRMTKTVMTRKPLTWHLLFISTGETRLADKMREAGQTIKGGQEVRFCDIEADTGRYGLFENLHEFPDGQSMSDHLRAAAKEFYGTPIRDFLQRITKVSREAIGKAWRESHKSFTNRILPETSTYSSEVYRVATRFALVAYAGEMATRFGITGWQPGEATTATEAVFKAWLDGRSGQGGTDAENAIRQVRLFLESHGQSRFQTLGGPFENEKIINRVGFKRKNSDDETEFLILPESFRSEVCKGLDDKSVAKILAERGLLKKGSDGKSTRPERCDESQLKRVYVISSNIFESTGDENYGEI